MAWPCMLPEGLTTVPLYMMALFGWLPKTCQPGGPCRWPGCPQMQLSTEVKKGRNGTGKLYQPYCFLQNYVVAYRITMEVYPSHNYYTCLSACDYSFAYTERLKLES